MMTRRELEDLLGCKLTDEQWEQNCRIFDEMAEREWEELHPLDD